MIVEIINDSINELPIYATKDSSGMDLRADFSKGLNEKFLYGAAWDDERKVLLVFSGGRVLVPTNIKTAIPSGYEIQIRCRSGLALKNGIILTNSIGTIDADYRNYYGVILTNTGDEVFEISQGDRIAQAVLVKVEKIEWKEVEVLSETLRDQGGFGHTGVK